MKEEELYVPVREFIERELGCFHVSIAKGTDKGIIDVVGLKNSMSDFGGHTEVIAVEVKSDNAPFLKSLGQSLAYSIMSDRCFLAIYRPNMEFSQEDIDQALRLGVGLIRIFSDFSCSIVTTSPIYNPLLKDKLWLIDKIGYGQCVICKTVFEKSDINATSWQGDLPQAINNEQPYRYWIYELYKQRSDFRKQYRDKREICRDCVRLFGEIKA